MYHPDMQFRLVIPMFVVDGEAVFAARCCKVDSPRRQSQPLKTKVGELLLANFAFSTAFIPGQGEDNSVFVGDVIAAVLGTADHASAAALRRLHFESSTLTAAELKRQTEATESDVPRKLPPAEIASRIDALQAKVLPLRIEDSLEPSHAVVNLVSQCVEDQRVRYIELCRVTTGNQEVNPGTSLENAPARPHEGAESNTFAGLLEGYGRLRTQPPVPTTQLVKSGMRSKRRHAQFSDHTSASHECLGSETQCCRHWTRRIKPKTGKRDATMLRDWRVKTKLTGCMSS